MYIPPQQSNFFNNDEFDPFEQDITSTCSREDIYVCIADDFNAQTGKLFDFTSNDTLFQNTSILISRQSNL